MFIKDLRVEEIFPVPKQTAVKYHTGGRILKFTINIEEWVMINCYPLLIH